MKECKYVDAEMILIIKMIQFLYEDLDESCGGICHIVTDDNNIDDASLQYVIEECSKEENKGKADARVARYICESLLHLTMTQREFLFGMYDGLGVLDDMLENIKSLQYRGCCCSCFGCTGDYCVYKDALNKFHAENECIKKTGTNAEFVNGNWPIVEVD